MTPPVAEAAVIDRLFHAQCSLGASDLHLCVGMPPLVRKDGQIMPLDAAFPALTDAALASLLEPIIVVMLGVIVGSMVIAMYLPIFKLAAVV